MLDQNGQRYVRPAYYKAVEKKTFLHVVLIEEDCRPRSKSVGAEPEPDWRNPRWRRERAASPSTCEPSSEEKPATPQPCPQPRPSCQEKPSTGGRSPPKQPYPVGHLMPSAAGGTQPKNLVQKTLEVHVSPCPGQPSTATEDCRAPSPHLVRGRHADNRKKKPNFKAKKTTNHYEQGRRRASPTAEPLLRSLNGSGCASSSGTP